MSNVIPMKREPHVDLRAMYEEGFVLYDKPSARGALTGWPCVDELYTVDMGHWTVVTGMPQSGKSEWLDALLVNLAEQEKWLFCVYSPENWPPVEHLIKLVEKRVRKPFYPGPSPRMSKQEYATGAAWILEHFLWLDTDLKSPEELIAAALSYQTKECKMGVVLDPWNTLDHQRGWMNETDYVSLILTQVTQMARTANAHVWLVVHPTKLYRDKNGVRPVPTPYDISGSAHWFNKPDNIITIHRQQGPIPSQDVEIHVQKVRFKRIGHQGLAMLKWDKVVGRYFQWDGPSIEGEFYADPERRNYE